MRRRKDPDFDRIAGNNTHLAKQAWYVATKKGDSQDPQTIVYHNNFLEIRIEACPGNNSLAKLIVEWNKQRVYTIEKEEELCYSPGTWEDELQSKFLEIYNRKNKKSIEELFYLALLNE